MAGTESIVDIRIGQGRQFLAEVFDILGLFLAEPGILQQYDVAFLHGGNGSLGILADDVVIIGEYNVLTEQFAQAYCNGSQRELFFRTVLRLAEMAAQDYLAAVSNQLFDGGQGGNNTLVIRNDAVLHGYVEITANQNPFSFYLNVINCFLCHG